MVKVIVVVKVVDNLGCALYLYDFFVTNKCDKGPKIQLCLG